MNRRDFLKLGGLFSTALFLQFNLPGSIAIQVVEVESQGNLYHGTSDGKILISANEGKTWQLHTNFGSQCAVTKLSTDAQERVVALIEYLGFDFKLALSNHNGNSVWRTV
jgi:hypothetical protein